jgi:hypothetical protein
MRIYTSMLFILIAPLAHSQPTISAKQVIHNNASKIPVAGIPQKLKPIANAKK